MTAGSSRCSCSSPRRSRSPCWRSPSGSRRASFSDYLALEWPPTRDVIIGVGLLIALIAAGDAALYLGGRPLVTPFQQQSYATAAAEGWLVPMLAAAILVAPVSEELMFRGFLFRGWARSDRSTWPAIVVISLLWAALHVQYDWTWHPADFHHRPVSQLDAVAQRLDAADLPAARLVQSGRHDRNRAANPIFPVSDAPGA